jgi:hypothetical protein
MKVRWKARWGFTHRWTRSDLLDWAEMVTVLAYAYRYAQLRVLHDAPVVNGELK